MANFSFNKIIIGGRLTADPELRKTPTGIPVTTFTVAVNRPGAKDSDEQKADFFNVTAWRQIAEHVTTYFRKASSICIEGSLQTRSWEKDGQKHYATEIKADRAYFVDSKSEAPAGAAYAPTQPTTAPAPSSYMPESYTQPVPAPQFETLSDDEELPF